MPTMVIMTSDHSAIKKITISIVQVELKLFLRYSEAIQSNISTSTLLRLIMNKLYSKK
ncbi:hypothetical protein SDC9_127570 [bioreactor metagenome]|uniref:Uncharacterized protein n=1 Tax=bioreactor metagenome TaxID=1076179 RepID=A0A645CUE2_9ZZZZ